MKRPRKPTERQRQVAADYLKAFDSHRAAAAARHVALMKMIVGALAGVVIGLFLGRSVFILAFDRPLEMSALGAMIGAIAGFSIARLFSGKRG